ncbi:AAA family ATPase [Albirhodobacter sp. R86504]|uniref:AAA family ATPase n=1 Tax=Albirhodobacter sp. R86504 TaxID=3093848 RepID=UPI00366B23D2
MTTSTVPARFLGFDLPTSPEDSVEKVRDRLMRSQQARASRRPVAPTITTTPDCLDALLDDLLDTSSSNTSTARPPSVGTSSRAITWSRRYMRRRTLSLKVLNHLKPDDRDSLLAAACGARAVGVVDRDRMEERIAELHAIYPWLAAASTAVMKHMRPRTLSGPTPLHVPPLILLGPPGIAKSSWARDLARVFNVPSVDIDVGATNGATFSVSGVERGWGSATPGRVVQTMLRERLANPVVILDEIDKIPEQVATSGGGKLPGAFEVLKSMIEPTTARAWVCPFYQLPFDLTRVSWIMTTNSIDRMPAAFLDRCKIIRLETPGFDHLASAGCRLLHDSLPEDQRDLGVALLREALHKLGKKHMRVSLRQVERMVETVVEGLSSPMLM